MHGCHQLCVCNRRFRHWLFGWLFFLFVPRNFEGTSHFERKDKVVRKVCPDIPYGPRTEMRAVQVAFSNPVVDKEVPHIRGLV